MDNKEKWLVYLPTVLYLLGSILFISYLFINSVLCMSLGALSVSIGALLTNKQAKSRKE